MIIVFLSGFAFFAGLIDSIAGGGGLISLPALILFNIPAHTALGTNKLQSLIGSSFSLINYWKNKKISWLIALIGIPFSLLGSYIGAKSTYLFSKNILTIIILVLIPASLVLISLSKKILKRKIYTYKKNNLLLIIFSCFFIGFYDGFYGPGTGTFLIIILVMFCNLSLLIASGTAKTFNLASNISAFITFANSGNIDYKIALFMGVFNALGNLIGSTLAIKKGNNFINKVIYVAILILFIYLVLSISGVL